MARKPKIRDIQDDANRQQRREGCHPRCQQKHRSAPRQNGNNMTRKRMNAPAGADADAPPRTERHRAHQPSARARGTRG
eukprot:scaffold13969_cov125-Isochrysis_galbana.AAC.2